MRALAIDCAVSKLSVAAKNDNHIITLSLDIGMRQSEKILPAIDYVLKEIELKPSELDYTTITKGPGSFTGLRLGISALKALQLANGTPIYDVNTLEAYAYPYRNSTETVLPVLDGNHDKYFHCFYVRGQLVQPVKDSEIEEILKAIDEDTDILACGPDAKKFVDKVKEITPLYAIHCFTPEGNACGSLFEIAEQKIKDSIAPLAEYEGPDYFRKSEAELVLEKK